MSYIGQGLEQAYSERFIFTASGGETSVSSADDGRTLIYTIGQVDVYKNGLKLVNGVDFVANTGTSITSLSALTAGDVLEVVAQSVVAAPDAVSASAGGTFEASIAVQGNISFTGGITGDGSDLTDVRAETVEVTVKNVSGGSLSKGTPVHQTGTSGSSTFEVVAANASSASAMPAHFVLLETLADQAEGRGLLMGRISGVDTSSFSEGDTIYVAAGGGFTNSPPTGEGNLIQNLGTVTRVDSTNGGGEVMGAGRSNATPNLNDGNIFLGNASNQAAAASLSTSVSNLSHYNNTNWDTAYGWGDHASAGYQAASTALTTSTTFGGDVSGTYNAIVIADDSHNHVISNVDGLQTALDAKQDASTALTTSTTFGGDVSGTYNAIVIADDSHNHVISNVDGLQTALDAKLASSSYTAADVLTKIKTVDGSGSGLDADLLDGVQSSGYHNVTSNPSTTGNGVLSIGNNGTYSYVQSHSSQPLRLNPVGNALQGPSGSTIWHSDNDGSGSGLDADLLDGINSTGFMKQLSDSSTPNYTTPSSRRVDPNATNPTNAHHAIVTFGNDGNVTGQLATHFQTGQPYTRAYNTSWSAWQTIWTNANDGSGSGLDADLLDGVQSSSFLRSDANDSFSGMLTSTISSGSTALDLASADAYARFRVIQNRASSGYMADGMYIGYQNTNSGITRIFGGGASTGGLHVTGSGANDLKYNNASVLWHAGNDGSGSGLDADLFDGQQTDLFLRKRTDIPGSADLNGYTSIGFYHQNANANAQSGSNYPSGNAGMLTVTSDGVMVYQTYHQYNGNAYYHRSYYNGTWYPWRKVWTDGNDGSGSGLDADTVDGIQGASLLRSDYQDTFTGNYLAWPTLHLSIANNNSANGYNTYFRGSSTHFVLGLASGNTFYCNYGNTTGSFRAYGGNFMWNDASVGSPWGSTNDGSGSGLDADLLDGLEPSQLSVNRASGLSDGGDISSHPGSNQLLFTGQISSSVAGLFAASDNSNSIITVNRHPGNYNSQLGFSSNGRIYYRKFSNTSDYTTRAWDTVWTSTTDGSGSGLDADLLDGYHSAENGASVNIRTASNGYLQLNNWMQVGGGGIYSTSVNGAHFTPNSSSTYGAWRLLGSRNGYTGILFGEAGGSNNNGQHLMWDSSGNGGIWSAANTGSWAWYYHRGNSCIGYNTSTTSGAYTQYVSGAIYATGNIVAYSDARVKENVVTIDNALEIVEQMRGVYYNKIDDPEKRTEIGFIAQEVDAVEGAKPLVTYAEDVDEYGVSYGNTTALLVNAVKELSQQVKDLKAELEALKNG